MALDIALPTLNRRKYAYVRLACLFISALLVLLATGIQLARKGRVSLMEVTRVVSN